VKGQKLAKMSREGENVKGIEVRGHRQANHIYPEVNSPTKRKKTNKNPAGKGDKTNANDNKQN